MSRCSVYLKQDSPGYCDSTPARKEKKVKRARKVKKIDELSAAVAVFVLNQYCHKLGRKKLLSSEGFRYLELRRIALASNYIQNTSDASPEQIKAVWENQKRILKNRLASETSNETEQQSIKGRLRSRTRIPVEGSYCKNKGILVKENVKPQRGNGKPKRENGKPKRENGKPKRENSKPKRENGKAKGENGKPIRVRVKPESPL